MAITPALAGPYDYGVVVVRVAIAVDPLDAHVIATSDTVPSIIGGVPIRMRSIQVNLDKPNFMINPTNCAPMSVDSQGIGDQGALTELLLLLPGDQLRQPPVRTDFSVREPGGRKSTLRGKNPALRFDLQTRPGDANIKSLAVTLPPAYAIDQRHLGNICSEKELTATNCAGPGQRSARRRPTRPCSTSPSAARSTRSRAPAACRGSRSSSTARSSLRPRAETKSVGGGLKTTVPVVPDAPIGHFVFNLSGGKQGYLQNTRDTCAKPVKVKVDYTAQSEKTFSKSVKVRIPAPGRRVGRVRPGGAERSGRGRQYDPSVERTRERRAARLKTSRHLRSARRWPGRTRTRCGPAP